MKSRLSIALACALAAALASAQAPAQEKQPPAKGGAEQTVSIPVTEAVLFTGGVGYFEHEGAVEGNARMELTFTVDQVNDLLKSLVLQDLDGGSIRSVTYSSRDPVARTLQGFAIDLTKDPTVAGLLAQTRGEAVELVLQDTTRLSGAIISVETRSEQTPRGAVSGQFLNLNTQSGVTSVQLAEIQSVSFARREVKEDLARALQVLSASHGVEKKQVVIHFAGTGKRRVRVGYILEAPVWKTSYRLVLGEGASHFLQGWAMVENPSDTDWNDLRLTLVSGRPVTFVMDLYQPLYLERPLVQMELYRSLKPKTYQMAIEEGAQIDEYREELAREAPAPSSKTRARAEAMDFSEELEAAPSARAQSGREAFDPSRGVAAAAEGGELGSLFQYAIDKPLTLPRRESALVPIVNQNVSGERFSIYSEAAHPVRPLVGVKVRNSSALHLMQGPITVFEGGAYAGDAQIGDMPPGAEQLLSFAVDLDVEVEPVQGKTPESLVSVRISKGVLVSSTRLNREKVYSIVNRGAKNKTVLVEHPFQPEWTLVEPPKPLERSRGAYRFAVPVAAGKSVKLSVVEMRMVDSSVAITNVPYERIEIIVRTQSVSQAVRTALQKLLELKLKLSDTAGQRALLEARANDIVSEQSRIRANMERLSQSSDLYRKYVKTLSEQEEELAKLREEISKLRDQEAARRKEIDAYVLAMDVK